MKKFTLMLAAAAGLTVGSSAIAQTATRHNVIVEVATGTWCQYCPGAALGTEDLRAAGASVGIVKHHNNDPYATSESDARYGTYYGVTGFPTAFFDGGNSVVGGNHTTSMYPTYNQKYNTAMAVATPFDITAAWTQNGTSIDITATVSQIGAYSAGNLRVQAVLVESHIQDAWQGLSECNWVNRDMYPDANGQAITLTQGGSQTLTWSMAINPSWVQNEMELVVWVENGSTKQIFNGVWSPLAVAAFANDPMAVEVTNNVGATNCVDNITPTVKIRNMGSTNLTSVDFSYSVNGGTAQTFTWTGNLSFLGYAVATLPNIAFTPAANNTLTVNITNSNDNNNSNNVVTKTWAAAAIHAPGNYEMTIVPDSYGSETTWEIKNGAGAVIASGGPYVDGNTTPVVVPVTINPNDCYQVTVMDAYGDGMCCAYGNGSYTLRTGGGAVVVTGGQFGSSELKSFATDNSVGVANNISSEVSVFPNPSRGVFNVQIPGTDGADITVMTLAGKQVYTTSTTNSVVKMDLSSLAAGMYMVHVKTAEGIAVKKITKE